MESVIEGIKYRKTTLKPIKIANKNPTTRISNHHDDGGINHDEGDINHDDNGVDNRYMTVNGDEESLSPTSLLFRQPNLNLHLIAIMGFKNPIDPQVFYEKLPHTLLKQYRFSSLQVVDEKNGGTIKWVPTNVNLDDHIIIPTIPQTLDSPDKFLEDYICNLSKIYINSSRPMWDLHILNLKTSNAKAIGIFRFHHSLGDGISLVSLLLACTRQVSNPDAVPTIPMSKNKNSGWFSYYNSNFSGGDPWWRRWFMKTYVVFWLVWNTFVDVIYFMATSLFLKDTETPLKAPTGAEFTPRRFVHRTVSLDDIKLIKNSMNMTINDVALGVTQAGLSRYLDRRYGQEKEDEGTTSTEMKNNLLKKKIRLRSTLVVNLRPSSGIQALADMMEKNTEAKWGNLIGYVFLPFTIGIKDDPIDYLRDAKATIDRKKFSFEGLYTATIINWVLKFFGIKASSMFAHRIFSNTTLIFSNMVGPIEEIEFYGHALDYIAPSCYGQPHGLLINLLSYSNKMIIVLSVDERNVPDPHKLLDDLEDSLKLIKEAVYAKGLVKNV